jgi:predicted RND superfamily exporter protein
MLRHLLDAVVLRRPWTILLGFLAILAGAATVLPGFRLDADSESLTRENDPERGAYERARALFGSDDYVIVAWAPREPWARASLDRLDALTRDLEALATVEVPGHGTLPGISRVLSPIAQPLLRSLPPDKAMLVMFQDFSLRSPEIDLERARAEMTGSALYSGNLVAPAGDAFALLAYFSDGPRREALRHAKEARATKDPAARAAAEEALRVATDAEQARVRVLVAEVRALATKHGADLGPVHASGVPTIVVDMVGALEEDMVLFGVFAVGFMVLVLAAALRSPRWVLLPMGAVLIVVAVVIAATILAGKKATVVTSNLSSLLLIVGMAHAVHIAVRSREVRRDRPDLAPGEAVAHAVSGIALPCLYACLTTAVGFASIAVSDLRPCIDFGLFMAAGTLLAYIVSFTFIPAGLVVLAPERAAPREDPAAGPARRTAVERLGAWTLRRPGVVAAVSAVVLVASVAGVLRLKVETRFTDYFREGSALAQGLDFIDRRIGGTTPLEVILEGDAPGYWRKEENYARLRRVHDRMLQVKEAGNVLSLVSLRIEGEKLLSAMMPGAAPTMSLEQYLGMAEARLGKERVRALVGDFVTADWRTARVQVRIRETAPTLDRQELLASLRADLPGLLEGGGAPPRGEVTGMFVLYTNMLRSLVASQEQTLGLVAAALLLMLWTLFRSLRLALLGLVPNILPIVLVLGAMGWMGIPLDMMTVMIASVAMGQAVDATIHYTFRWQAERAGGVSPDDAVLRAHGSVGRAIFFTAFTVVGGFWVLVFSNFKPTIYFGIFTSVAMASALLASLLLLPVLLRRFGEAAPAGGTAGTAAAEGAAGPVG